MPDHVHAQNAVLAVTTAGAGPHIVCLHAGVADRRSWAGLQDGLADRFAVTAYDRRGFGETTYTPAPHDHVADLLAVLEHLGADSTVLVGNSQGGLVAVDAVLEHPDRFDALILMGPAVRGAPPVGELPEHVSVIADDLDSAEEAEDLTEVNRLEARLWLDGPGVPEGRVCAPLRDLFLDMNGRALRAEDPGPDAVERLSVWDRLGDIRTPTLVIGGEHDVPHIVTRQQMIVERIPGARFVEVKDAGHLPGLEHPSLVAEIIADFLNSLGP